MLCGRERSRQINTYESTQWCISTWHLRQAISLLKVKYVSLRILSKVSNLGIVIIHQELALIPYLSISENIFLGNEQARRGIINWNDTIIKTRELLQKVGLNESAKYDLRFHDWCR